MATYRDTYRYHFKKGDKIIHTGITCDIDRREAEHRNEPGMRKGYAKQVGWRTTYDAALEWAREQAKKGRPVLKDLLQQ